MNMIEFKHGNTQYKVSESNAARYRAILDSGKFPNTSSKKPSRKYPEFYPGMTTAEYVESYVAKNDRGCGMQHSVTYTCPRYDLPAPMLDATQPEVIEEIDPDYVEPQRITKRKPSASQQLVETRAAIERALFALAMNDAQSAERILRDALQCSQH
jgi:hypothetical protein